MQAQAWIGEKWKTFGDDDLESLSNLKEKMKRLQKHQAFEAEIKANEKLISDVKQVIIILIWNELALRLMNCNLDHQCDTPSLCQFGKGQFFTLGCQSFHYALKGRGHDIFKSLKYPSSHLPLYGLTRKCYADTPSPYPHTHL